MKPFDDYPNGGVEPLGPFEAPADSDAEAQARRLCRLTKQNSCAYCGIRLIGPTCKTIPALAFVVPVGEAMRFGLRRELAEDTINTVLCCSVCSRRSAGYEIPDELKPRNNSRGAFIDLRDAVLTDRRRVVVETNKREKKVYRKTAKKRRGESAVGRFVRLCLSFVKRLFRSRRHSSDQRPFRSR